jgi:hypothetical protein
VLGSIVWSKNVKEHFLCPEISVRFGVSVPWWHLFVCGRLRAARTGCSYLGISQDHIFAENVKVAWRIEESSIVLKERVHSEPSIGPVLLFRSFCGSLVLVCMARPLQRGLHCRRPCSEQSRALLDPASRQLRLWDAVLRFPHQSKVLKRASGIDQEQPNAGRDEKLRMVLHA